MTTTLRCSTSTNAMKPCRLLDKGAIGLHGKLNLKVGQIYDIQGKRDLAIKQYNKVLNMKDYDGTHAKAEGFMKKAYKR